MPSMDELERRKAALKERERTLNAQIKAKQARERERERKARTHALVVYGAMVEQALGKDWRCLDEAALVALDRMVHERLAPAARALGGGQQSTAAATAALRAYQRYKREAGKPPAPRPNRGGDGGGAGFYVPREP